MQTTINLEELTKRSVARRAVNSIRNGRRVRNIAYWTKYYEGVSLGALISDLRPKKGVRPDSIPTREPKGLVNEYVAQYGKKIAGYANTDIKNPVAGAKIITELLNDAKSGNLDRDQYLDLMKRMRDVISDAREKGKYGVSSAKESNAVKNVMRGASGPNVNRLLHPISNITDLVYPLTPSYLLNALEPKAVKETQKWWRRATTPVDLADRAGGGNGRGRGRGRGDGEGSGDSTPEDVAGPRSRAGNTVDSRGAVQAMETYTESLLQANSTQQAKAIRQQYADDPSLSEVQRAELDYNLINYLGYEIDIDTNPYTYFDLTKPKETFKETFERDDSPAERYSKYVSAVREARNETELALVMRAMARDATLNDNQKTQLRASLKMSLDKDDKEFAANSNIDNLLRVASSIDNGDVRQSAKDNAKMAMSVDLDTTDTPGATDDKQTIAPSITQSDGKLTRQQELSLERHYTAQLDSANSVRAINSLIAAITNASRDGKIPASTLSLLRTKAMSKKKSLSK